MLMLTQLTAAGRAEYRATIARSHEFKVTVQILAPDHRVLSTITARMLDGQVDARITRIDSQGRVEVGRNAQMTFLDPDRSLAFDGNAPTDGALYLNRMIRIIYSVRCPSQWVDVPVFTGPVTEVERDGAVVTVEADGKERYGMGDAYQPATYKGRKIDAFSALLWRSGELDRYREIPKNTEKLVKTLSVAKDTRLWDKAFWVMQSMNRLCYYDGRGICRTPFQNFAPVITMWQGDGGLLLTDPQVSPSSENLKNVVEVIGAKAEGAKAPASARVVADRGHPLSPFEPGLGRNGKPHYRLLTEENTNIRTFAKCVERAKTLLKAHLEQVVTVKFECLPVPHLEPWDRIQLNTPKFSAVIPTVEFTLPLTAGAPMTIGYTRRVARPRFAKVRSS